MVRFVLGLRPLSHIALVIRNVAHRILQHQEGPIYTDEQLRSCVTKLCHLARVNAHIDTNYGSYIDPPDEVDAQSVISSEYFNQQLLNAAAFFGITEMVEDLCSRGFYHHIYS